MIVAAAFCPQPPLLVPAVASGAAGELDGLRAACREAIRAACVVPRVIILGAGTRNRPYPSGATGTFAAFGVDVDVALGTPDPEAPDDLPPSIAVGAWLVGDALDRAARVSAWQTSDGTPPPMPDDPVALVVMGDGSARRSTTAPGYLDDRAAGFDAAVAAALAGGYPEHLAALDAGLGRELLAAGVPAWHAAAAVLAGRRYDAHLGYEAAPYGVGYVVARWTARA